MTTTRPHIALATYEKAPRLAPDDRGLIPALAREGVDAVPTIWSRDREWDRFDAVVIRSCWDYHRRAGEFLSWLGRLSTDRIPTWNSPDLIRWNSDKRYLLDLERKGVVIVPTIVVPRGRVEEVLARCDERDWTRFVIKPVVSASGYETHAFTRPVDVTASALVARVLSVGDALLQPFAEEVERDGEYSFTFIDGELSHAAIKRAAAGEFRVQTEYGGSVALVDPPDGLVEQAANALAAIDEKPLYARVDGIARGDAFLLTELELIEPNLFLEYAPGATERLARAIAARVGSR
jgi:glutathione synthase/RimK-type ligase-like ATP-grasp enzyme